MPARVLGVGVRVAAANIWTAIQTFGSGLLKLRNPAGTFTYIFKGGAIVADRDVTMPLLTGNDVIVTEGMAQTLTNKTLTAPDINGGTADALTSLAVRSTGTGAFDLKIANAENLTVGAKTLTVQLGDADRTLILGASPSLSGTNTGDNAGVTSVTGTAPIASSGGATPAISLDDGGVTLAKMANLAQDLFIGRTTASTGVPETATITAAARTVLDDTTVAAMVDTLGGAATTGTGGLARATSPTFVTPALGTPASGVMTNVTGIPEGALALTDITTANASATAHGLVPKWPNNTTTFFRGDGTYAAPGGGGAVTRAGGNTTEATTTSTTIVNLLSTTVSIGANIFTEAICSLRKTAGAAVTASVSFKVNTTQTASSFAWCTSGDAAAAGFIHVRFQTPQTNYFNGGTMLYGGSGVAHVHSALIGAENLPIATYTAIVFMGLVGNASITMGADEMHVYTYSVS